MVLNLSSQTRCQEIKSTFAKIKETFGRLDVVYNYAGYGILVVAEATLNDLARDMFEVNFWGLVNVTKKAVGILAFGNFKTNALQTILNFDFKSLPAYEGGAVDRMRGAFSLTAGADPAKAAREMYSIANDPGSLSRVRLFLGADIIPLVKGQIKQLQEVTDASEPLAAMLNSD
ncbi:hypothetical protein M422DRAFT_257933 [Sphaerobolus stellatus SS14]|uniref:Uncharacterized protein n=1 Tax=Sphaerobolus stellatus (strain SS14) TaxID=990650 RepID=A0A0C9VNJ7_SPHS4|nr:hypothetical protein M422DRAFT_257933 [Sphaerobolus stellatus SS14]